VRWPARLRFLISLVVLLLLRWLLLSALLAAVLLQLRSRAHCTFALADARTPALNGDKRFKWHV
jgi:hypothetical protein